MAHPEPTRRCSDPRCRRTRCDGDHAPSPDDARERLTRYLSSLPRSYHWATFGAELLPRRVSVRSALDRVQAAPPDTLVITLTGPAGAGKTSTAAARGRQLVELGYAPLFATALDLVEAHRSRRLGEACPELMRAQRADVLILDDVGQESERASEPIVSVIHHRHAAMRPTIVATGLRSDALAERYGSGILRRLTETGRALVVACGTWPEASS